VLGRPPVDTSANGFPVLLEPLHHGSLYWWQTFGSCRGKKFLGRSTMDLEGCNFIGLQKFPFENFTILIVYIFHAICVVAMLITLRRETRKFLQEWLFYTFVIEIKISDVSRNGPSNNKCPIFCHFWNQVKYRPYCHLFLTDGNLLQGLPRSRSW